MKTQQQIEELAEKEYPMQNGEVSHHVVKSELAAYIRAYTQAQEDMKAGNGVTQDMIKNKAKDIFNLIEPEDSEVRKVINEHRLEKRQAFGIGANWALSQVQSNADELAVGFGNWCMAAVFDTINGRGTKYSSNSTTDLLDIYKKEKGI